MNPGVVHAIIGAGIASLVAIPAQLLGASAGLGAAAAIGFYVGRERRQSEEWFGSNRISPLIWRARAWRDMAWPAGSALVTSCLIGLAL